VQNVLIIPIVLEDVLHEQIQHINDDGYWLQDDPVLSSCVMIYKKCVSVYMDIVLNMTYPGRMDSLL
jgi:uncharacterized protein YaaR (DUF327 family)